MLFFVVLVCFNTTIFAQQKAILNRSKRYQNNSIDFFTKSQLLGAISANNQPNLILLKNNLSDLLKQVEVQEDFVKVYLSKNPNTRKRLFTQYTFFGMPLN